MMKLTCKAHVILTLTACLMTASSAAAYYTTRGVDIVNRETKERVILRGFGIGGWLLPEGYMWGIRELNRPRQFEAAIVDLIGEKDAEKFWKLYHDNFFTREDVQDMASWGVNSIRIALLASKLQPREGQPDRPPYRYSEDGFAYLDRVVDWCEEVGVGVIWDMHGAPGAQNAENISDSDGEARLWTQQDIYWPRCIELWSRIAERYKDRDCIIGYDLLNEPLLARYEGVDPKLLRDLYVKLTREIRRFDDDGIIFIEGDEWAQEFSMLEPLDWDPHLVVAFHSYPPTYADHHLSRWIRLRDHYNVPLWHGETGEVSVPFRINRNAIACLERNNVGWSWWTHKKLHRFTQPWFCRRTPGFQRILDYWKGKGPRPARVQARAWLFEQARRTHTRNCTFIPDMARSLTTLDTSNYVADHAGQDLAVLSAPRRLVISEGDRFSLPVLVGGYPESYRWLRDGREMLRFTSAEATPDRLYNPHPGPAVGETSRYALAVESGGQHIATWPILVTRRPFAGPVVPFSEKPPSLQSPTDSVWRQAVVLPLEHAPLGKRVAASNLSANARLLYDDQYLYVSVAVVDDVLATQHGPACDSDGIELYIDFANGKKRALADHDIQIVQPILTSRPELVHGQREGLKTAYFQPSGRQGYTILAAVPWRLGGGKPVAGRFIGLDVHVNDNDGRRRERKLSWYGRRDTAWRDPSTWGTVRLGEKLTDEKQD